MSFFANEVADAEYGNYFELTTAGYAALVIAMLVVFVIGCLIFNRSKTSKSTTKQLAFSAMAIALALVTSMIKLLHLPMGGSITLCSMFFMSLVGYWYGLGAGITAAVAYGFLQLIIDPYIISLPQMLVDYIFAFGALGLSGLFSNKKHGLILGYIAAVLGRYVFAFLSGMIFFGSYAADFNMIAPVYSLLYNGAYLGAEAVITIIIIAIPPVSKALSNIKKLAVE